MDVKFGDVFNESELDFLSEPQVTSSDPEVRKLSRQLRIQRRLEKLQGVAEDEFIKTALEDQLEESAKILTILMREGDETVTNVRVASDSREVDRREAECINRQKVIEQMEVEAVLGQEMFEEITNKWPDVFQCNDPIHIHEELELQKERCNELIRQKDALITFLKDEVKRAEIKFTNDQHKQNEDIKSLGQRIEKQVSIMRSASKEQLKTIEDVLTAENKGLVDSNNRIWDGLYRKRETEEVKQMRETLNQIEEYHEGKKETRFNFQEKYRALKILLAEAIQNLQITESTLKANALMNQEMLDYNYQILRKKEDENLMIGAHQKRQINKLQDIVGKLKKKINDYDIQSNIQIENLKTDVKKLQARVVEMENKAINLSKINERKYNQVWDLNVEDVTKKLNKVLTIDKLLHEQHLGLPWQIPKLINLDKHHLRSYRDAKEILREEASENLPLAFEKSISNAVEDDISYKDLLRHILQQVAGKSDFLIEDRVQEMLEPFVEEESMLVKIDNVFRALRLEEVDDIDLLLNFFQQYAKCDTCQEQWTVPTRDSVSNLSQKSFEESSRTSKTSKNIFPLMMKSVHEPESIIDHALDDLLVVRESSEEESAPTIFTLSQSTVESSESQLTSSEKSTELPVEKHIARYSLHENKFLCELGHPLSVHPSIVIEALRKFILSYNSQNTELSTLTTRLSQPFLTVSRLMIDEDVELFWKQYKDAFSKGKEQLWDGLLFGLKQYYEILRNRKQLNDEVMVLRKQNAELNHILHSYTLDKQKTVSYKNQRSPFSLS